MSWNSALLLMQLRSSALLGEECEEETWEHCWTAVEVELAMERSKSFRCHGGDIGKSN